jgi:hypothetical protein
MQLRFLSSTLILDTKHDATDRFMRDTIRGCYGAERFLLLHHTMYDCRPKFRGNTVVRLIRSWSSVLAKKRVASFKEVIFRLKVLRPMIQFLGWGKEGGENW